MSKHTTTEQARAIVAELSTYHALSVCTSKPALGDPAVVCWRCEESIGLEAPVSAVRAFARQHARCDEEHYCPDDVQDTSGL